MENKDFKRIVKQVSDNIEYLSDSGDNGSFKELVFNNVEILPMQSIYIKTGNILESAYNLFINEMNINKFESLIFNDKYPKLKDGKISIKNKKYQLDVLFRDVKNDTIYYLESKANINLDTEKSVSTSNKATTIIKKELELMFPTQTIISKVLAGRVYREVDKNKEALLNNDVIMGYNEFFDIFNVYMSKNYWENMWSELGDRIISKIDLSLEEQFDLIDKIIKEGNEMLSKNNHKKPNKFIKDNLIPKINIFGLNKIITISHCKRTIYRKKVSCKDFNLKIIKKRDLMQKKVDSFNAYLSNEEKLNNI